MQILENPLRAEWDNILLRPNKDVKELTSSVQSILNDVRERGDCALKEYELRFDKVELESFLVSDEEMGEADSLVSDALKHALLQAYNNIRRFHQEQQFVGRRVETQPGVYCWQKSVPIEKVGLYVPGGTAPLFSTVLMLATPANIAGCRDVVLCTPPDSLGKINPAILVAARIAGVNKVFKIGGAQAIAAMAYGTESVPKVYKIFGPGNQYVTAAKQLVSLRDVAIDMPAGPSEVMVVVDETSDPAFVASDLLSQAEHGVDSQSVMVTSCKSMVDKVLYEVGLQLEKLPRKDILEKSLKHCKIIVLKNMDDVVDMVNLYAPEHLVISISDYMPVADRIINAGSVFLGHYSCESAGDYASGTNHTLPTNGYAKAYSGVSLDSFIRKITFQEVTGEGVKSIGPVVELMAENEMLQAHKNAMTLRMKSLLF